MSSIVSDVGGTNARFALAAGAGAGLSDIWTAKCADFPTIEAAVEAYRETLGAAKSARLDAMAIAVAGPVNAETVDVTNNHWLFNKHDLLSGLSLRRLLVINDFTAQALAQTDPRDNGNVEILPGESDENAPLLVIGPGTGLGVSALIPSANGPIPIEGEGGHVSFSPRNDDERALDAFMRRHSAHVSAEHFVSGGGLENIHHFMADRAGQPAGMTAPEIGERAIAEDGLCRDAAMLLLGILGTVITDNVLTLGCWRGVVISGGIVPKLAPLIAHSPFAERMRKTGLTAHLMEMIPVWMSVDPYAGLRGAEVALGNAHLAPRAVDAA
jgi:glucokinase